jgi:hypothetical protein
MKDKIHTLPTPKYDPMTDPTEMRKRLVLLREISKGLREYDPTINGFMPEYDAETGKLERLILRRHP